MSGCEQATALLVTHQRQGNGGCLCGAVGLGESFPAHQAAVLEAAGLLAGRERAQVAAVEALIDEFAPFPVVGIPFDALRAVLAVGGDESCSCRPCDLPQWGVPGIAHCAACCGESGAHAPHRWTAGLATDYPRAIVCPGVSPSVDPATEAHPPCCGACGGAGGTLAGPCWDCRGTGHPHP